MFGRQYGNGNEQNAIHEASSSSSASPSEASGTLTSREVLLRVEGLTKQYRVGGTLSGYRLVRAVSDVTLSIHAGETFGLVGETGSGKSTTGRLVLALERPTSGTVTFAGQDLSRVSGKELRTLRRMMQPISQDPYSALNGRMRISEILAEPFAIHGVAKGVERRQEVEHLLELVGLPLDSLHRFPYQFSGGQRQRLVIARAIALRPRFIVADEPLSALDVSVQAQIINLLRHLQRDFGLTYLFISHDLPIVRLLCDVIDVMYMGKLVELASREQLFGAPAHPYSHALLAAVPVTDPSKRAQRKKLYLSGEVPRATEVLTGCVFHSRCPLSEARCVAEVPVLRSLAGGRLVACHFAPVDENALIEAAKSRNASVFATAAIDSGASK